MSITLTCLLSTKATLIMPSRGGAACAAMFAARTTPGHETNATASKNDFIAYAPCGRKSVILASTHPPRRPDVRQIRPGSLAEALAVRVGRDAITRAESAPECV